MRLRRTLLAGGVIVLLSSVATLALASRRITAEQAAFSLPGASSCAPARLNRSDVLPHTSLAVAPLPDSRDASARAQISMLGAPVAALSAISVRGSSTGAHPGSLRGYSQGDGASFVPSRPFAEGETVTVRGRLSSGGGAHSFAFHFNVAHQDVLPYASPTLPSGKDYNERQHYHSRPDLQPPVLSVTASSAQAAPGYLFTAPYAGPGSPGPAIFDQTGQLVWFNPLPGKVAAANLQVQQLGGQPVLTWWQGYIPPQGFGMGEEIIESSSYHQIGRVHAGNGYRADLHDFHITPQGTALLTAFNPVACDLSSLGGPAGGAATDNVLQELDLRTGLVRREWHSLDHISLADSYSPATGTNTHWPYDYFHVNSIDQHADGTTLISARNTWALYRLNTQTGQVLTTIGGRRSSVKLSTAAKTAYQHDATLLADGTISVFDNGAVPAVHPQSRGLILSLNAQRTSESVRTQFQHHPALVSGSQGNIQQLPNGDLFLGWGSRPYLSEFSSSGALLFDAHMHGSYQSYRGYRFPWTGTPPGAPALSASPTSSTKPVTVFASWNGDTRTASWRVLAGPSASSLSAVAGAPRAGFETAIATPGPAPYVAVQALDSSGAVIGTSATIHG